MYLIPSPSQTETRSASCDTIAPNPQPSPRRLSWLRLRSQPTPARTAAPRTKIIYALARPRRMKYCARRVLLWTLGFYAAVAVFMNVFFQFFWIPDLTESVYRFKWPRLKRLAARTADRPLVLSLGSSRMDAAFQARRLDGRRWADGRKLVAYNFCIPAAGPLHENQYLRDMLEEGIRPNLLVVEVLPPLFNAPHTYLISEELWGSADWMSLHHFRRMHRYFHRPYRKLAEWVEGRVAPVCVHRRLLHGVAQWLMKPENEPVRYENDDCWGTRIPPQISNKQHINCMIQAVDYMYSLQRFRLGKGPVRAFRNFLKCCRREQIPVVLVLMPESSVFRSWYRPECLAAMNRLLAQVHEETGVPILDARLWLADSDFIDGHHPLESGARIFTKRMMLELNALAKKGLVPDADYMP